MTLTPPQRRPLRPHPRHRDQLSTSPRRPPTNRPTDAPPRPALRSSRRYCPGRPRLGTRPRRAPPPRPRPRPPHHQLAYHRPWRGLLWHRSRHRRRPQKPRRLRQPPRDQHPWFDGDASFDFLIVPGRDIDWDGDGDAPGRLDPTNSPLEFQAFTVGFLLQPGPVGLGLLANIYGWQSDIISVNYADIYLGGGLALFDGELVIGLGAQIANLTLSGPSTPTPVSLVGSAPDLGVLYRPADLPFRFGARFRSAIRLEPDGGDLLFEDSPVVGVVPWTLSLGASYQLTANRRPMNPPLRDPFAPPADRRYVLVSAELVLLGATYGTSLEGLVTSRAAALTASPRKAGHSPSVAFHLGGEGEVIHHRLRARFGTYFEPIRVAGEAPFRLHLTGGLELRLFEFLFDWKATLGFDLAPGWENFTIGVGFWN